VSNRACIDCDAAGRPFPFAPGIVAPSAVHDLLVPICSDIRGNVRVDDVIPKGLRPPRAKRAKESSPLGTP
jgi:hypothetical protein